MGLSHQKECHFENQIEPLNHPILVITFLNQSYPKKSVGAKPPASKDIWYPVAIRRSESSASRFRTIIWPQRSK